MSRGDRSKVHRLTRGGSNSVVELRTTAGYGRVGRSDRRKASGGIRENGNDFLNDRDDSGSSRGDRSGNSD